jgi:hypothetical protein
VVEGRRPVNRRSEDDPIRIPITKVLADGRVIDGTAKMTGHTIEDFRDLDGQPMVLEPGARLEVPLNP